jgi:predicted dehydrogenase
MSNQLGRRDVLKGGAWAGLGMAAAGSLSAAPPATKPLRIGFVGTGGRGTGLIQELLTLDSISIPALCDVNENNLARAQAVVQKAGLPKPEGYSKGEFDFRRLCDRDDLDLVINATPWQYHTPICVAAMKAGKHAATEVPAALTVDECWELVETSEKTGKQCSLLENVCYDRDSLMVWRMLRDGILGEPLFAEAGYLHDIRGVKWNIGPDGEKWRLDHSIKRDGNLYPTHPLGPVAWWYDINRGDQFSVLTSMSTKSRSMQEFAIKTFGPNDPRSKTKFALGDVNVTLIKTHRGRTISLYHDTNTPRPKEMLLRLQGSKGAYSFMKNKIFIDGRSNRGEGENWLHNPTWEDTTEFKKQYEHPLWKEQGQKAAKNAGHGGIDYLEMYRLVKNLREGKPLDIDVYDAAAWSVIVPLSEKSVANRSKSLEIPDFTRGKWKTRPQLDVDAMV